MGEQEAGEVPDAARQTADLRGERLQHGGCTSSPIVTWGRSTYTSPRLTRLWWIASLVDISAGGAMIEADISAYGTGEEVAISVARIELVATIAWLEGRFVGLAFHRRSLPTSWTRCARPAAPDDP